MRKIFLTVAAVLTFTMASAQECCNNGTQQKKECCKAENDKAAEMAKQFGLNDEQTQKVRELNAKYPELASRSPRHGRNGRRPEGRKGGEIDGVSGATRQQRQMPSKEEMQKRREKMMTERKERQDNYNKELKTILTAEQYALYEKNCQEKSAAGRQRK